MFCDELNINNSIRYITFISVSFYLLQAIEPAPGCDIFPSQGYILRDIYMEN